MIVAYWLLPHIFEGKESHSKAMIKSLHLTELGPPWSYSYDQESARCWRLMGTRNKAINTSVHANANVKHHFFFFTELVPSSPSLGYEFHLPSIC